MIADDKELVNSESAIKFAREVGAAAYVESSAKRKKGVEEVFTQSVSAVIGRANAAAAAAAANKPKRRKGSLGKGSEQCIVM